MLFVIGTQTTGARPEEHGVWELGCVAVERGQVCGEWSSLVRLPAEHRTETHLSALRESYRLSEAEIAGVCDAPPIGRVRAALVHWMCLMAGAVYRPDKDDWKDPELPVVPLRVTSYHAAFERAFLEQLPWSLGYFVPVLAKVSLEWTECAMLSASEAMGRAGAVPPNPRGGYRWPKLYLACEHFGVALGEGRRALPKARAAAGLAVMLELEEGRWTVQRAAA